MGYSRAEVVFLTPDAEADFPSDLVEQAERRLVASVASGDQAALGQLFDRYHLAVFRYLSRLSGSDSSQLDDLVQATFIEVLRAAPSFDARSRVRTWLFGIASNIARHHRRSEGRRRRWQTVVDELPEEEPARISLPDGALERSELLERLGAAVLELPPDFREVFVACEVEALPGTEVARALGIPEGTLWRRLHEARKRVEARLGRRLR